MLTISTIKNQAIENVTFPVNSVVLIKYSERETSNGIDTTIKYVACDGVKNTKDITIIKTLLSALLAEFIAVSCFNNEYSKIVDENGNFIIENGEYIASGIQAKRYITPFLSGNAIYKTDSNGKLSIALQCEDGIKLRDTALYIRKTQAIAKEKDTNILRAIIHNQSKAILAQFTYLTDLETIYQTIKNIVETEPTKETKTTKTAKTAKETKESTPTEKVA